MYLVAVSDVKVRAEVTQIDRDLSNRMRAIHIDQGAITVQKLDQLLDRMHNRRYTRDPIHNSQLDPRPILQFLMCLQRIFNLGQQILVANREGNRDLDDFNVLVGITDVTDGLVDRDVAGREDEDAVTGNKGKGAEDGVDADGGVGDEGEFFLVAVDEFCELGADIVQGHVQVAAHPEVYSGNGLVSHDEQR